MAEWTKFEPGCRMPERDPINQRVLVTMDVINELDDVRIQVEEASMDCDAGSFSVGDLEFYEVAPGVWTAHGEDSDALLVAWMDLPVPFGSFRETLGAGYYIRGTSSDFGWVWDVRRDKWRPPGEPKPWAPRSEEESPDPALVEALKASMLAAPRGKS